MVTEAVKLLMAQLSGAVYQLNLHCRYEFHVIMHSPHEQICEVLTHILKIIENTLYQCSVLTNNDTIQQQSRTMTITTTITLL